MPPQRSSGGPPRVKPAPPMPARVTLRLNGREYVGEGVTRLEAFAVAVQQCAPQLRDALRQRREREAGR